MPKLVSEIAQGNTFSRSSESGAVADSATRAFKVILDSPNEALDIFAAIGVNIGDLYSSGSPIPCVSIEGRSDGDSRLVRIITAQYRSRSGGSGSSDPGTSSPDVRPANFSTSTSLYEAPAYKWSANGTQWEPIVNPVKDQVDGITKMEAITTIRVTQFQPFPGTVHASYCGYVNQETMSLGGYMTCDPKTVMFRGVEANPAVESFGGILYRGFNNAYEFAFRANYVDGLGYCGWDVTPLVTGFNIINTGLGNASVDQEALAYEHDDERKVISSPLALIQPGKKVRAMVSIPATNKGYMQNPCASPVALNEDGTPRARTANPPVLVWRRQVQPWINLTNTLQLRLGL